MVLPLTAWLLASAIFPLGAGAAAERGEVNIEGDLVSVFALSTPVDEILRPIGWAAGFSVSERCGTAGCAVVSGNHRGTLSEIMAWLLRRQNHVIVYSDAATADASAGIARIVLLPGLTAPNPQGEFAPSRVVPSATAQDVRALRRLRAARLAPPSWRENAPSPTRSGPGFATLPGVPTLARSAERGFERPASPASGYRISSDFGWRHDPFDGQARHHDGVDLIAPPGTPLKSALAGTVVFAGWAGRYGDAVEIDHGGEMHTRYAHLSRVLVEVGERVRPGQTIGLVGDTGRSTGPHLHFEIHIGGQPQDPVRMVDVWPDLRSPVAGRPEIGG
ncbi:MAG TPA: M23 family metallopeptidase [Geminicoccaceae bacterium]|nr:M23 family metallopeptidase [Geminicoccaceae bacterium]